MKERKLRLVMDDLRVETFEVARDTRGRGTVHANGNPGSGTRLGGGWGCECGTMHQNTCGTCADTFAVTCPPDPACGTAYETNYVTCGDPTCHWDGNGAAVYC